MLMEARKREGVGFHGVGIAGGCKPPLVLGSKLESLGKSSKCYLLSSFPVLDMNFNSHSLHYEEMICGLRKVILTSKIFHIAPLLDMELTERKHSNQHMLPPVTGLPAISLTWPAQCNHGVGYLLMSLIVLPLEVGLKEPRR